MSATNLRSSCYSLSSYYVDFTRHLKVNFNYFPYLQCIKITTSVNEIGEENRQDDTLLYSNTLPFPRFCGQAHQCWHHHTIFHETRDYSSMIFRFPKCDPVILISRKMPHASSRFLKNCILWQYIHQELLRWQLLVSVWQSLGPRGIWVAYRLESCPRPDLHVCSSRRSLNG